MINLEFRFADGRKTMAYDVHPASQAEPIVIPDGAVSVVVWLGTWVDDSRDTPERTPLGEQSW